MKKFVLAALVIPALLLTTCKTDIDLLDDWKETAVVYGLLDQSVYKPGSALPPKQFIRIQKAYLGEGNALEMAQVYDSINYINSLNVNIEEWNNGNLLNTYVLQPDTTIIKDAGLFAYPNMVLYATLPTDTLDNPTSTYKLVIRNSETGNEITAQTLLVGNFNITAPSGSTVNITKLNASYKVTVGWNSATYGRVYQPAMRIFYNEVDINNVSSSRLLEMQLGTEKSNGLYGGEPMDVSLEPGDFYRFLNNNIASNANILYRTFDHIEFIVYAGGDDLSTYIDVNAPSTSIVQEKPIYTNINNGLGLFSSRYSVIRAPYSVTPTTLDTLAYNANTCHLRFKDRNGVIGFCQ
ncbi:MAG: hypothetical protein FD123_3759 [Bacteroidetes bacterium]|nr:MAG: hypothetical protein FD123_3759 [Bacteroidota bacterium]